MASAGSAGPAIELTGVDAALSPLALLVMALLSPSPVLGRLRCGGTPTATTPGGTLGCGTAAGAGSTARMEYTATSFAEPLQRVFDDVLRPEQDIDVTHTGSRATW